jgi:hypothetical protein
MSSAVLVVDCRASPHIAESCIGRVAVDRLDKGGPCSCIVIA